MIVDPVDEGEGFWRVLLWPHESIIVLGGEPALYRDRVTILLGRTEYGYNVTVDTAVPKPWCKRCFISLFDDDMWMKQVRIPLVKPAEKWPYDVRPTLSPKKKLKPRMIVTEYYGDIEPHTPSRWSILYTFFRSKQLTITRYENCMSPKVGPRGEVSFCESVHQVYQSAYEPPLPVPYAWITQENVPSDSGRCGITQLLMMNRIYFEYPGRLKPEYSGGETCLLGEAEARSAESSREVTGEPACGESLCFSG